MKLASDDNVVDMAIVRPECDVLTVSRNGFGKRVDIEEFRLQSRAGKGIKAGTFNEKTGRLVNMKLVDPEDDVMVISDNGTIIRMLVKEISKISRDTQGVRMMRVKNQGQVVCVATAPHQEVIEDEGEPAAPAEE
jgi:DNA gyrase subunit A